MSLFLVAAYQPTALFSLKDSQATNAAGKTLLVPSPYAVKMALLDAAVHWQGITFTQAVFPWLKGLKVRASPPKYACVTNAFIKIQRPWQPPKAKGADPVAARAQAVAEGKAPWQPTIAFREYAQFRGTLQLAFEVAGLEPTELETLRGLLLRINYFGKRGSFFQLTDLEERDELGPGFVTFPGDTGPSGGSVLQYLDDFGPKMTWEMADSYDTSLFAKRDPNPPDRVPLPGLLPYRLERSSKRSTLYVRVV